jgi:hypothetical protein
MVFDEAGLLGGALGNPFRIGLTGGGNPGYPPAVATLGQDRNPLQGLSARYRIALGKSSVDQRAFAVPIDEFRRE